MGRREQKRMKELIRVLMEFMQDNSVAVDIDNVVGKDAAYLIIALKKGNRRIRKAFFYKTDDIYYSFQKYNPQFELEIRMALEDLQEDEA